MGRSRVFDLVQIWWGLDVILEVCSASQPKSCCFFCTFSFFPCGFFLFSLSVLCHVHVCLTNLFLT